MEGEEGEEEERKGKKLRCMGERASRTYILHISGLGINLSVG